MGLVFMAPSFSNFSSPSRRTARAPLRQPELQEDIKSGTAPVQHIAQGTRGHQTEVKWAEMRCVIVVSASSCIRQIIAYFSVSDPDFFSA
jgi:hypothetical protein